MKPTSWTRKELLITILADVLGKDFNAAMESFEKDYLPHISPKGRAAFNEVIPKATYIELRDHALTHEREGVLKWVVDGLSESLSDSLLVQRKGGATAREIYEEAIQRHKRGLQ